MNSSSVLIVHPSADRFRLSDMSNGKLNRHYSLDSPSLTSPPGYDPSMMDSKAVSIAMSHPNTSVHMGTTHQFSGFNPQFVMAQSGCAPPSLLHISKWFIMLKRLRGCITGPEQCRRAGFIYVFLHCRPRNDRTWIWNTSRHALPSSRSSNTSWNDDSAAPGIVQARRETAETSD